MSAGFWLANIWAYSLQLAAVAAMAGLLVRLLRLRAPGALLLYWQALLASCLLLPAFESWRPVNTRDTGRAISTVLLGPARELPPFPLSRLLLACIAAGIVFRLLWLALGYLTLSRYRRAARALDASGLGLDELQRKLDARADMRISAALENPVTFGIRRATVLLPVRWLELDGDQQQAIACHELLHIRRGDWAFHLAEEIIRAALWFHPAVWWIVGKIRLTREQVVDRGVIELTSARQPYIEALIAFSGTQSSPEMMAAPAFSRRRHLVQRVSLILEEITMSKSRLIVSLAAITVCMIAAGLLSIRSFPLVAPHRALAASPQNRPEYVHHVGEAGVVAPRVLYKEDPQYTQTGRDAKIEGTVVLQVEVEADGRAHNARIIRSLDPGLDQNALDAVATWQFQPATKDGQPVTVEATIEVNYRLR
jgi:bla regulator protein blaR1